MWKSRILRFHLLSMQYYAQISILLDFYIFECVLICLGYQCYHIPFIEIMLDF